MWHRFILFVGLTLCSLQVLSHQSDSVQAELIISQPQDFTLEIKLNYLHLYAELLGFDKLDKQALAQLNGFDDMALKDLISRFNQQFKDNFVLVDGHQLPVDYQLQSLMPRQLKRMLKQKVMYGRSDNKSLTIRGLLPQGKGQMAIDFPDFIGTVKLRRIEQSRYLLPPGMTATQVWSEPGAAEGKTHGLPPFLNYIGAGFIHIIPLGLDHILFMLGLFLLNRRWKILLLQLSVFTLAHSITLGLASFGWQPLPSNIVEPLIALSIVWVAVENLLAKKQRDTFKSRFNYRRLLLIFAFGLLHGLGFASVFLDSQSLTGSLITQLVGFNLGVELGQMSVVALAFLLTYRITQQTRYHQWVVVPGSAFIACVAGFWTVQRLMLI